MNTNPTQSDALPFEPTPSIEDLRIGRVYAEALLNAAEKQNAVQEVQEELDMLVSDIFHRQPQIEAFLASGIISEENKQQVLKDAFQDRASPLFFNFLMVLCKHGRLDMLRAVRQEFQRLLNHRQGRIPVQVQAAVALTDNQLERLRHDLRQAFRLEPLLDVEIDPALLGGMVVRVGDWMFDRSVRSELDNLRKQLIARSGSEIAIRRDRFGSIDGE